MHISGKLALSAALGAGFLFASTAHAQDFARDYDQVRADRASEGQSVMIRFTAPFGATQERGREEGARLSLRLSDINAGDARNLDVVSYAFNAERVETPFALYANGDGEGWFASTPHKILFGVGAALLIWGIVEATEDDDDGPPAPPPPT